jgi:hypothetical protein
MLVETPWNPWTLQVKNNLISISLYHVMDIRHFALRSSTTSQAPGESIDTCFATLTGESVGLAWKHLMVRHTVSIFRNLGITFTTLVTGELLMPDKLRSPLITAACYQAMRA